MNGLIYPPSIWGVRPLVNTTFFAAHLLPWHKCWHSEGRICKEGDRLKPRRPSMLWAIHVGAPGGIQRDINVSLYPDIPWRGASGNPTRSNIVITQDIEFNLSNWQHNQESSLNLNWHIHLNISDRVLSSKPEVIFW